MMPDVFTANLEPDTLWVAAAVLERLDYSVAAAPFLPAGKFDHVKGKRKAFAKAARAQGEQVAAIVADGAVPVVIEPAIALLHGHEYPAISSDHPIAVRNLAEVILDRISALSPVAEPQRVTLLGHCTERATAPHWLSAWSRILSAAGHRVSTPDVGCCGMAGIFGHEIDNQAMSRKLFDLSWAEHTSLRNEALRNEALRNESFRDEAVVATGYSCRSQTKRFAQTSIAHPIHLLLDR